ncbi:membrane protein [Gordonia phage Madeline]|uniref:Membrane protein n=1 Tax=Gordonia phage Madeline TaxID=2591189 RepID=A0A514A2Z8_9CAUD|nr:membrane protein [Gordonia phage Madeline]QDH47635.1 membrane protein [Gordonia phage Madeline]
MGQMWRWHADALERSSLTSTVEPLGRGARQTCMLFDILAITICITAAWWLTTTPPTSR